MPMQSRSFRIKAARIAAPYLHSHAQPKLGEMRIIISNSFGFEFDPEVVNAEAERTRRFYAGDKTDPSPEQLELLESEENAAMARRIKLRRKAGAGGLGADHWPASEPHGA